MTHSDFGFGPWFIALMFNENEHYPTVHRGSKRKSDILLHTYAHRVPSIRNAMNKHDNWKIIQLVGPFSKYNDARAYHKLWTHKVRSKIAKLKRGFRLLHKYHKQYNLTMWYKDIQVITDVYVNEQLTNHKINGTSNEIKMDIQSIRDMQKRRLV